MYKRRANNIVIYISKPNIFTDSSKAKEQKRRSRGWVKRGTEGHLGRLRGLQDNNEAFSSDRQYINWTKEKKFRLRNLEEDTVERKRSDIQKWVGPILHPPFAGN